MADTFDPTLPTPKDQVRLLIGDTNPPNDKFTDEAINATITFAGSVYAAAATLADSLAAQYSAFVSISVDGLTVSNNQKATAYQLLASRLRAQGVMAAPGGLGAPFVGGVSVGEMDSVDRNTDRPPSSFKIGMQDDPPQNVVAPRTVQ